MGPVRGLSKRLFSPTVGNVIPRFPSCPHSPVLPTKLPIEMVPALAQLKARVEWEIKPLKLLFQLMGEEEGVQHLAPISYFSPETGSGHALRWATFQVESTPA